MVQAVHFRGIDEGAGGFVTDKGVVFPRIPQPLGHFHKLVGHAIAQVMFRVFRLAVIERGTFQRGGHDIPPRSSITQVIDGGKLSRDRVWLTVGRRQCGGQANVGRNPGQCGQQGQGFKTIEKVGV